MTTAVVDDYEKAAAEQIIEQAQEDLGLTNNDVAAALRVNQRTVYRYKKKKHVPRRKVQVRMEKLRDLHFLLSEVFATEETKYEWLYTPVPALQDRRPIDQIRQGKLDEVIAVLSGIYSGAYT